jgi:large subunit ribosomal protein L25
MKSIKGSEKKAWAKITTKALCWRVPCVLYGGDQPVHFQQKKKHSKLGLHSNAHTVVIDLGKGKSFTLF